MTIVLHDSSIRDGWVLQGDNNSETPKSAAKNGTDSSLPRHYTIGAELVETLTTSIVGAEQLIASLHTLPFPSLLSHPAVNFVRGALLTPSDVLCDSSTSVSCRLRSTSSGIRSSCGREAGSVTKTATDDTYSRSGAALADLRSLDQHSFCNSGLYRCLNGEEGGALTSRCGGGLSGSRAGVSDACLERNVVCRLHSRQPGSSAEHVTGCLAGG